MRVLLGIGIMMLAYLAGVGFLRTASKAGWNESGEAKPYRPVNRW